MKVGIVGLGCFGRRHLEVYESMPEVEEIWASDPYIGKAEGVNITSLKNLIHHVDAVSIAAPSALHYEIAIEFLKRKIPCMIEKPIATVLSSATYLHHVASVNGTVLQIGHIERFNSEYMKWRSKINDVLFIDANRLCNYTGRCQDVDVVLDLMIHDIDIALQHIKSPVESITAKGAGFCTPASADVAYACLQFANGSTATITAHRASVVSERRTIFYGADRVVGVDYTKNNGDSLYRELSSFIRCCQGKETPLVTGEDGRNALDIALQIKKELYKSECVNNFQWKRKRRC